MKNNIKTKKKRFRLFELDKDQFIDKDLSRDTVSEVIFEAKYSEINRYVILDSELSKIPIVSVVPKDLEVKTPVVRIAGQDIEVGKYVSIPSKLSLRRHRKTISVWDKERLEYYLKAGDYSLKNTTILDKIKVLQIHPDHVSIQGYQVSSTTLKAKISKEQDIIYDKKLVPFNFKEVRLNLYIDENKILFM